MLLALDIAFANLGWSVLDKGMIVSYGTIRTEKTKKKNTMVSDDRATRGAHLSLALHRLILEYKPQGIVGELPGGSQNASAANLLGWASGIVVAVAACHNLPCEWISQGDSKKAALGVRSATKEATMAWAIAAFPDTTFPSAKNHFEHVADSLAAYHGLRTGILVRTFG